MAKSKAEIQKEYNEALQVSQSLTGALNKMIDDTEKSQKKVSDAQKEFNNRLKSINSGATDYESTQDAILALEKQKAGLSKRYFGANKKLLPQKQKEVQANIDILSADSERLKLTNELDSKAMRLSDTLTSGLDGFQSSLGSIPVLGGMLQSITSGPLESMKGAISDSAKRFVTGFSAAAAGGKAGIMGFVKSSIGGFRAMGVAMLTGPQAIIFGIVAVIALAIKAFANMEAGAKAFRDETGLLNSQTKEMEGNINSVYLETVGLGASMEDVAKAAADFTNEFGGIEQPAANTMKSMTVLSKNFGVSTQDAAKLNKAFQNMSGMSEEVAQSNLESLTHLAKQAGVAPGKVMADIAESAEDANGFFRGNVQAMGAAAINAAKMGTSLKKAVEISRGLLNYQDSIGGEMEASAILGTNLNFSQSRYLAAQGDVVGAQASMVEQLRNQVDLQNMSVFEQEALEKATGMTLGEMQNMARIQELGLSTEGERGKLLQKALKAGMDISNMSKEEIAAATDKLALEEERQGRLESLGNKVSALGASLTQAFLPIGEVLMGALSGLVPILSGAGKILTAVIKPIVSITSFLFKGIGKTIEAFMGALKPGFDAMMNALKPIQDLFAKIFSPKGDSGKLMDIMNRTFSFLGNIVGTVVGTAFKAIGDVITHIANTFGYIIDFFKGDIGFGEMVSGILGSMVEMVGNIVTTLWEGIKSVFSGLGTFIYDQIKDTLGWFGSFFGGDDTEETETVRPPADASLQEQEAYGNYKDNPIMAAKSPIEETEMGTISQMAASGDIVGAAKQVAGTDMSEVVNAIKELTNVSTANKDVYIDNEKITSRITKTQEKSNINQFGLMGA